MEKIKDVWLKPFLLNSCFLNDCECSIKLNRTQLGINMGSSEGDVSMIIRGICESMYGGQCCQNCGSRVIPHPSLPLPNLSLSPLLWLYSRTINFPEWLSHVCQTW